MVPVRGGGRGKSRLPASFAGVPRHRWVLAFAADTIAAVRRAPMVGRVVVALSLPFPELEALVGSPASPEVAPVSFVLDATTHGLNDAILAAAAATIGPGGPVAVLPGDLPCLLPADFSGLLAAAEAAGSVVVPDAEGRGSVALVSASGHLMPRFGRDSLAAHLAVGYQETTGSDRMRRDVDTLADLVEALALGVGGATSALAREARLPLRPS